MSASVKTSQSLISIVEGVALDVMGCRVVQEFYHLNVGRFLNSPMECGKCDLCNCVQSNTFIDLVGQEIQLHRFG
jgi:hypothetical protein